MAVVIGVVFWVAVFAIPITIKVRKSRRGRRPSTSLSPGQRSRLEPALNALGAVDMQERYHTEHWLQNDSQDIWQLIGPSEQIAWLQSVTICTNTEGEIDQPAFCVGVLMLTDRNLVFLGMNNSDTRSGRWALTELATVDLVRHRALGPVLFITSGAARTGFAISAETAQPLLNQVRQGIVRARDRSMGSPAQNGVADQLTKLAKLLDAGLLTEREYSVQKAKLLNQ